ncbi:MAG TPA: DUF3488 and transglutaminase-like domain-containing protein [Actinomycetota bacterium]
MARTQGTNARTQRLTALLATALLATATAFAIGRVFVDHASTYRMAVAGLLSAAIAVALERRSLLLATVVSAVAMIVVVGFMVFPDTTWHGVPTLETLRAMLDAAALVGEQARVQVAPTEPLPPLMLAALTATWAAIFSSHALAFRAGSPILALLPPIALVAFADTVLEEIVRPLYGVAFLIAATAMIFADGLRRVQGWGPVWTGPGRDARLNLTAGRGARRVAAAAIGVAALSPLLLPGFGSKAIIDLSSSGGDQVRLNPLVSVSAQLQRDDPVPVFNVVTEQRSYWRVVASPHFDGINWNPDSDPVVQDPIPGTPWQVNDPADPSVSEESFTASFRTTGELALPWLPMPYPAVSTDLRSDGLRWDPEVGALELSDTIDEGVSYDVVARSVRATPDELRDLPEADPAPLADYLNVPADLPDEIALRAETWMEGAGDNVFDRVMAIQQQFTSDGGFTYDDGVRPDGGTDALVEFLDRKTGFCQQFASAMAVMLRTQGIPSRVAVGYTAGAFNEETGEFRVTTDQAHAWVEVYFPTYGWLTFDPTPNRADTVAYPYLDPAPASACSGPRCFDPDGEGPIPARPTDRNEIDTTILQLKERGTLGDPRTGSLDTQAETPPPERAGLSPRGWLLVGAAVVAVGFALIPPVRALRRRRRLWKAAREPRTLILATYDVFTERAAELGFPRAPSQTLQEYQDGVCIEGGLTQDPSAEQELGRLTTLTSDAAYAEWEPEVRDAADASRAASATLKALRHKAGWARRITGPFRRI